MYSFHIASLHMTKANNDAGFEDISLLTLLRSYQRR